MKKAKSIQRKVKSVLKKVKAIENFADHPMQSLGGTVGARLGNRKVGSDVGRFLGKIAGVGDYKVKTNSLASVGAAVDSAPSFGNRGRGVRVTHREFLGNVVASNIAGAFQNVSYAINPGNILAFPWLCQIASNYDQWQPNGVVVVYKSLSSSYSGTASLGSVTIASDYDVYDTAYGSKIEMENSQFCVSGNCARDLIHPIECSLNERFTRVLNCKGGAYPTGDSRRFYDLCNLQVATEGATASQVCGELWISYDITFFKEQLGVVLGATLPYARGYTISAFDFTTNGPLSSSNFTRWDNMPGVGITSTAGACVLTIPKRYIGSTFLFTMELDGANDAATVTAPTPALAGLRYMHNIIWSTAAASFYIETGTIKQQTLMFVLYVAGSGDGTLTLSAWTYPTSNGICRYTLQQINPENGVLA